MMTEKTKRQRVEEILERLGYISSRPGLTQAETEARYDMRQELAKLRDALYGEHVAAKRKPRLDGEEDDESQPLQTPDSVWETLRKISGMGDTVKIMCSDRTIDPQNLMLAGFRGAVRLAKQALKDAGK